MPLLDLAKARKELAAKDLPTIERETALTWGGRAAGSYSLAHEAADPLEQMRRFWEGETFRSEALEHAAMTEDTQFLADVIQEIETPRAKARDRLLRAGHAVSGADPATKKQPGRSRGKR